MTQAHAQDFERKRKPGLAERDSEYNGSRGGEDSEDDDDEDEDEVGNEREDEVDVMDAAAILERHRSATG